MLQLLGRLVLHALLTLVDEFSLLSAMLSSQTIPCPLSFLKVRSRSSRFTFSASAVSGMSSPYWSIVRRIDPEQRPTTPLPQLVSQDQHGRRLKNLEDWRRPKCCEDINMECGMLVQSIQTAM